LKILCSVLFLTALRATGADAAPAGTVEKAKAAATPIQEKGINYLIDNGPKLLGALLIIVAGLVAARWVGKFVMSWLLKKDLEPPVRMLITRLTKLLVVAFALVIALGTMGVNMMAAAPNPSSGASS